MTSRAVSCLFVCLAGLLLFGCAKREPAPPEHILRISQRNEPATLDPHLATLPDEFFVIRALGEGLLVPVPDGVPGGPRPGAAESWTVSADGRTYTFRLRADARWSNGDPVTAADFAYSIRRALTPGLAAPKAALFFPLRHAAAYAAGREPSFAAVGVRALGDRLLQLELEQPQADFPAIVASGPWIPVHPPTVERAGGLARRDSAWARPGTYVGNGPFVLAGWLPGQEITVRRNLRYHDADAVRLDAIRFPVFDNGDTEERAFRTGQVDVTLAVPFTKLAAYRDSEPAVLHTLPLFETRYLALNVIRPPLDDPRVRRALSLALDRSALTEKVLRGGQQPALSFIPPGLGGYAPAARLHEDAAEARRLLAEAGFPDGRGFPRLELATWPVATAQLEAIQQMWRRELAIEVTLAPRDARAHLAALAAGDYALAFATAIPDYAGASDLFTRLTSGNPNNYPHWRNPAYDRLAAEAGRRPDAAARLEAAHGAERLLLEELPVIPLYFNAQNFLLQPRVRNWRTDRLWTRFYADVFLD
jgi:oligopeptide transport system substrate-binding protein